MQDLKQSNVINKRLLFIIIIAFFALKFYVMTFYAERFQWDEGLDYIIAKSARQPLFFLLWLLCLPLVEKIRFRFPFSFQQRTNLLWHIVFCIILSLVVEFASEFIITGILYSLDNDLYISRMARIEKLYDVMLMDISFVNIAVYWLLQAYYSSIEYLKKFKKEATKRAEAEKLIAEAELNALKMQIQPHFLFNTLHSISSLIDEDTEEAQDMVGRLGELLRYTLDQKNDFIPLSTELEFIQNYLEIEQIRFKERLRLDYHIDEKTEPLYVPSFILQPLIENSIKHGLSNTSETCHISINSNLDMDILKIKVEDNGKGSTSITKGVGLTNTEQRLKNYYDSNFTFEFGNREEKGFYVYLEIPISESHK